MVKYGLISETDARTIEKTLDLLISELVGEKRGPIHTCEIGIFNGDTSRGINQYISQNGRLNIHTAIDNNIYGNATRPFPECIFVVGNSTEVAYRIPDESQHFIFVDGCHAFHAVVADFFCYATKVVKGGYMAFHDTGVHIKSFKDYQDVGSKDDPDMYISVRKALESIGLFIKFEVEILTIGSVGKSRGDWQLVFDEADQNNEAGGVCVFKKLY